MWSLPEMFVPIKRGIMGVSIVATPIMVEGIGLTIKFQLLICLILLGLIGGSLLVISSGNLFMGTRSGRGH